MAENKIDTKSHSQPEAKPVKGKAPLAQDTEWDLPVAIREIAEKGVVQVKDASEKIRSVAVESTDLVEDIYLTATKGLSEFNLKALDALRTNINASFEFTRAALHVKTLSQALELTSGHFRKQFEVLIDQSRELTEAAQKLASETVQPVKASVEKVLRPSA